MNRLSAKANTNIVVGVLIASAVVVAVIAITKLDTFGRRGGGLGNNFKETLEKLARIDPNLILYEESAKPIKTGFAKSRAIAVGSKGTIYVAGDNQIRIFNADGTAAGLISPTAEPYSLAIAEDGNLYVGATDHVEVYGQDQKRLAVWPAFGVKSLLTGIAISGDNLFVADQQNLVVVRYDLSGKLINEIGRKDPQNNIPGFVAPSPYFDLAVSKDGLLRVANPGKGRIEAYTFDGDLEFSWGKQSMNLEGFMPCCNPVNFAVLPDGNFVTAEKGVTRIKIYSSDGAFLGVVAGPDQLLKPGTARVCEVPAQCQAGGFDVAVDTAGRVFVLDTIENLIRIYTKKKPG